MIKTLWSVAVLAVALSLGASPALAHAERTSSTPEPKARLDEAPNEVEVTFTEPPIADADFKVLDGCDRDVVEELEVQGTEITASLAGGQPGRWRVDFQVVSAIDGHATTDAFGFLVQGSKDCSSQAQSPPPAGGGPEEDDGGGQMLLIGLFVGGTVLVVALAFAVRGRKSG